MATPAYIEVLSQINTYIVANGNNEITANVLNPVLKIIADFANNNIGDLSTLTTEEKNSIVESINSLKQDLEDLENNGVQLYSGIADPNDVPPPSYNYADFYMQVDIDDLPIKLWQWNGFEWKDSSSEPSTETDNIENNSDVPGVTATEALNNLNSSIIYRKTILEIRSLTGILPSNYFYTTDLGKNGNWYYDSSDTTSLDNTGTILVTSDGKRIKRILNGFVNAEWFGAVGDNSTDNTTAIQAALNFGGKVLIPSGTFISSNLTLNSKNTLCGAGESSILKFKSGSTGYFLNGDTKDGILITELLIDGGNISNYSGVSAIGTRSGIYLNAVNQNNKITKCKITGFNAIAIGYNGATVSINESVSVFDCNISYNYCGVTTAPSGVTHDTSVSGGAGGEYSKIIGCTLNANRYAVVNSAGNTNVTGNNMSGNGYGIYSTSVANVGHGNVVSNEINHSTVYGLYMISNNISSVISNNAFFYGDIYFELCSGIIFTGNQLAVNNVSIINGGYHNLSDNYFYITPTVTGDLTNSIFVNNNGLGIGFINNNALVTDSSIRYDSAYNSANTIVTNGDFAVDANWTKGAGWTISGGKANSAASGNLSQSMSFVNGTYYVVEFDVSNYTSGSFRVGIGGITLSGFLSYNGRKRLLIQKPTSGGDSNFYIVSTAFVGSIDNVLVYESLPKKLTVDNGILSKEIILSTNPATATGTPDILVFENSSVPVKKIPYSYISRPYKSYSFLATQSGTGNPSITTLENQLSTTGVWTRTGAGAYQISLSVPIDAGKCISPQHSTVCTREFIGGKYQLYVRALSTTELQILVKSEDGSTDIDDMLLNKPIEFRVYN